MPSVFGRTIAKTIPMPMKFGMDRTGIIRWLAHAKISQTTTICTMPGKGIPEAELPSAARKRLLEYVQSNSTQINDAKLAALIEDWYER